jgi:hypothetical protein
MAQEEECLPNECEEALNLNPSSAKNSKTKVKQNLYSLYK